MRSKILYSILPFIILAALFSKTDNARADWLEYIGGRLSNGPSVADDGTVYQTTITSSPYPGPIESWDGCIYAFYPDGTNKWQYCGTGPITYPAAIGDDGTIYASFTYYLSALNPDGSLKWEIWAGDLAPACQFRGAPAIAEDGTIYIGSVSDYLFALNPNDGSLKWSFELPFGWAPGTPSIGIDGTIYVGTWMDNLDNYFYAIDPAGNYKWHYFTKGRIHGEPVIGRDGTIYISRSTLTALFPNGVLKWETQQLGSANSPTMGLGNRIYITAIAFSDNQGGILYALDTNGNIIWQSYEFNDAVYVTPAIDSAGRIYFGLASDQFYIFSSDGSIETNFNTNDLLQYNPAISKDGWVIFNNISSLIALDGFANAPAPTSWPMYRGNQKRNGRVTIIKLNIDSIRYLLHLVAWHDIDYKLKHSLSVKLENAISSLEERKTSSAVNKIKAFINHVEAQEGKKIASEDARELIWIARRIVGQCN